MMKTRIGLVAIGLSLSLTALADPSYDGTSPNHRQARTQSSSNDVTCIYKATVTDLGLSDVVIRFSQDDSGQPIEGSIQYLGANGQEKLYRIPADAIQELSIRPGRRAELRVNVHVRSEKVDMILNYAGNNFRNDTMDWLRVRRPTLDDMINAYSEMRDSDQIQHRMTRGAQPVAQMTGSIKSGNGLNKIASTLFVCTQ
jgi:hypothetical protein